MLRCRIPLSIIAALLLGACDRPPPIGAAITRLDVPATPGSAEPHLAAADDGAIVLSWLEPVDDGVALRYSTLLGDVWQPARTVARGDDWFVNWADFPSVVPVGGDLWAAHWLVRQEGDGYAYDVAISLSPDRGRTWLAPITPHHDGTPTEHGFVSLYPAGHGVGALWLDGRDLAAHGDTPDRHGTVAGTALRTVTLAVDVDAPEPRIVDEVAGRVIDEVVCDCCQTDVAVGPDGPIGVYRNRTPEEIRDIHVTRAIDGVWQPGRAVGADGWHITGCPVNGPAIAVVGARVAVAWFTAADEVARVRLAVSADGGDTFGSVIDVDETEAIGRVDVEIVDDGDVIVSWLRAAGDEDADVVLRRISGSGGLGPIVPIARTGGGRPTGFPQMVRNGVSLVIAWTDTTNERSHVRAARVVVP